jgi:hypothetical protein
MRPRMTATMPRRVLLIAGIFIQAPAGFTSFGSEFQSER